MVKAKPNQKIHVDKLQNAFDKLEQLESKPVEELTLRESIYFLRDKLNSALKKGYSYDDLSSILAEQDILVSAATLKLYLAPKRKKSSSRKKSNESSPASITKSSSKTSTNVTSSEEELGTGYSQDEINRMKKKKNSQSEQAVHLNSTTEILSSSSASQKTKPLAQPKSQSIGNKSTTTKAKVMSGSDDDLKSEFNDF
jgi:hypothetical protein